MLLTVFIIGLNHAHQYPGHRHGDSDAFYAFLRTQSIESRIGLVAEELSTEALRKAGCAESTAQRVADNLGIRHLFCDPDSIERSALGIPSYEELKALRGLGRLVFEEDAAALEAAEREHWGTRELEWVRRIQATEIPRALVVVGSEHVESFADTLRQRRHAVNILAAKWEA